MDVISTQLQHISYKLGLDVKGITELVTGATKLDMIVFSHLRWQFVLQRPQHIINRFARDRKVLFVEEPLPFTDKNYGKAKLLKTDKNITVLQPHISHENLIEELVPLVKKYTAHFHLPLLWFYSPMFADMMRHIDHSLVVYDCMDELSAFKGAPPRLKEKEHYLLDRANIVFTGGKSLYESKKKNYEHVYCFPSSVDRKHFEKVWKNKLGHPKDLSKIPAPRVGFYGVIDERIDLALLEGIAKKLPHVSFIMIGPVVKIDPSHLPKVQNVYYLGGKDYDELPRYLQHIDVAMMPFALNESTQFISPTKTLEFMAARKPIISTPIYDVVRDYAREVCIAHGANAFSKGILGLLSETPSQKRERIKLQDEVIEKTSWDKTVTAMKSIIKSKLTKAIVSEPSSIHRPLFSRYSLT